MKTEQSKFIPFNIVKTDEGKTIITLGRFKASPIDFANKKEAETYLKNQPYEMFFNLYSIIKHYENDDKNRTTKNLAENS